MKKIKITFNISKDVLEMLEKRVPKRRRDIFIEEAIHARFSIMEEEQAMRELVRENRLRDEELELIDAGLEQEETFFNNGEFLDEDDISEFDDLL